MKENDLKIELRNGLEIRLEASMSKKIFMNLFNKAEVLKGIDANGNLTVFNKSEIKTMYFGDERVI